MGRTYGIAFTSTRNCCNWKQEFLNINCLPSELNLVSKTMWQSVGEMEHNEHYIGNALFLVVFVADDFFSNKSLQNLTDNDNKDLPSSGTKYVAVAGYDAVESTEISFQEGDTLELLRVGQEGWWFARHQRTVEEGWVPASYLDMMADWWAYDIPTSAVPLRKTIICISIISFVINKINIPVVNIENSVTDQSLWEGAKRGRKGKMLSLFFHRLLFNFLSPDRDPCRGLQLGFK